MAVRPDGPPERSSLRVGLDIGGTKIEAVAVAADGTLRGRSRRPTRQGAGSVVEDSVLAVETVAREAGATVADVVSVGVGVPGLVTAGTGHVVHAVNLGIERLDLGAAVQDRLGVAVRVENDVKAAARGASALRGDRGALGYLNLGTGVAAGIVVGGCLHRGSSGLAGEIGHIAVDPGGRRCGCGQIGCIETLCGGGALARAWGRPGSLPVRDIFDAAESGDADAQMLRRDLSRGAAAAVRVLALTVDVDRVVIGGGLTALGARLEEDIRRALRVDAEGWGFLGSLDLADRIELLPPGSPVAALGAALVGAETTDKETLTHG